MSVDNGNQHRLVINGVHDGLAGSQRASDGRLTVAFKPNVGMMTDAATTAVLDGTVYEIVRRGPSRFTSGFIRVELREPL